MKCNWNALTAIATIAIAIGGLIGLYYVVGEFGELRKANEIALSTVRQSYRPLAIVRFAQRDPSLVIVGYGEGISADRFTFGYDEEILNRGLGVLIYLGYVSYLSTTELNFRNSLMDGKIDTVSQDDLLPYARRRPIAPGEAIPVTTTWMDIPFLHQYFAYSLHFYEDLNGGLYDTEHLNFFKFAKPFFQAKKLRTKLEPGSSVRETYHYYSQEEKVKLIKGLKKSGSNIADALTLRK
jgi:hypothetical protein